MNAASAIPPPYPHQAVAQARLRTGAVANPNVYALVMDRRCGKSRPLIEDWWSLVSTDCVDDLLVIAPKGCYLNWTTDLTQLGAEPGELQKWLPPEALKKLVIFPWTASPGVRKRAELGTFLDPKGAGNINKHRVFLVNVEALSSPGLARASVESFLRSRRVIFAIDESTCIMHESARTVFIQNLRELSSYRRILTGLVAPENPLNVFHQYWFLDWRILGFRSYQSFQARYAITKKMDFRPIEEREKKAAKIKIVLRYIHQTVKSWLVSPPGSIREVWLTKKAANRGDRRLDGLYEFWISDWLALETGLVDETSVHSRGVDIVVTYKNQEELAAKLATASYRVEKEDVLGLPPKLYQFWDVEMADEQARMYDEMRRFATTALEGRYVTAAMKMHQIQKLHEMLCGHVKDEQGIVFDVPNKRIDELMTLLQDHSGKAIIWAPYPRALEKITAALRTAYGERSTVTFWGATSDADRKDAKYRIQKAEDTRFIAANQAVGGEGNTWTAATLTVYYANSRKNKDRQQSEDRPLGKGQMHSCAYVDLRVRGTVDEKWITTIRNKMNLSGALMGDRWKSWLI